MEIIVNNKKKNRATAVSPGAQKSGVYPFVTENLTGEPVLIKSHKHRRSLMEKHSVHDDKVSTSLQNQRRRLYVEDKKEKKREILAQTFMKCKYGKLDTRPADMKRRKMEYERRNGKI